MYRMMAFAKKLYSLILTILSNNFDIPFFTGRYPGAHDALYRNAMYPGSRDPSALSRDPSALSSKYSPLGGGMGERLTQSHLEDKERGRQFMHEQVRHLYTEQVIKKPRWPPCHVTPPR